jgi:hypothetical protein
MKHRTLLSYAATCFDKDSPKTKWDSDAKIRAHTTDFAGPSMPEFHQVEMTMFGFTGQVKMINEIRNVAPRRGPQN